MQGWCFTGWLSPGWLTGSAVAALRGRWMMPMLHVLTSTAWFTCCGRESGQPGCEHPEGPGCPRNAPGAVSAPGRCLCSARCAQAGEHVAVRLRSETRTRHIIETGISCHRRSLTYLCHFNALHSEPGLKKPNTLPPGFSEII